MTRVLADWHHPALWESLRILFEDRFDWELYSMTGPDWLGRWWRFETRSDIGWTALDYLVFPDAIDKGTHWERIEPEYPDHPRKLVTWDQAKAMDWDFVLASVPQHERPFARLARRLGARFIHQIGNAKRHRPSRNIPQVTLASRPFPDRDVVVYHQEFDRRVFDYTPPSDPSVVSSFMLRLDWTSCPWRWFAEADGVRWWAVEAQDPRDPDYLAPMSRVADRIRSSGWVWHDKRIGDGYGHVLHTAVSMGRPLIGHASHFAEQAGERLWIDGETCIDLDLRTQDEALRLWREIVADPDRHREMAERTAALFDDLVDFDAEAEAILRALS